MQKIGRTVKRRRKEGKTDYKARLGLLKSKNPRLVVRKTNKFVIAQIISTEVAQDKIDVGVISKDLLKFGWPKEKEGSLKSLAACYLTGFLLGKKAGKKSVNLDLGLQRNAHGGRLYAVLKGAVDAGLDIKYDEKAMPQEERIKKDDLKQIFEKVKGEITKNG